MLMFYVMPEGQFLLDEHGHDEDFCCGAVSVCWANYE